MSKKIIKSFILVTVMVVLCFAIALTTSATNESDFIYTVSNDKATITGYVGEGGTVNIPEFLGGYPVAEIGDFAFSTMDTESEEPLQLPAYKITSITIPESVVYIGEGAFYRVGFCNLYSNAFGFKKVPNLTVFVPSSVEYISASAFWCSYISASGGENRMNITILFQDTEEKWNELDCAAEHFEDKSEADVYVAVYNDVNVVTFQNENPSQSACEHEYYLMWDPVSCTEVRYGYEECSHCGSIRGFNMQPIGGEHNWYEMTSDSDSGGYDCTLGLTIKYSCERCYDTKTKIVAPKEHDWYTNDTIYDCEEGGTAYYYCNNCMDTKTETVEPKDHDWYEDYTYTYDCEELAVYRCHDCSQEKEEVVFSWHDWYEHEFFGNCEEGGKMEYFCHNCSHEKYESVDPQPHTIKWHYYNDATCTKDGTKYSYCTVCDYDSYDAPVTDEGSALGHDYSSEWVVLLPATCYDRGVQIKHCSRCTEITAEALARTAHTDNDGDSKCDECLASLSGSTDTDTSDTPEEPEEETNVFSFLTELINTLVDFFKKIFGIA